ncbi:MAG: hypothetical protein IT317_09515 [Anaerolineales bacterium]|nr:hypothetical protein [Anaerolineales bacterium]
MADRKIAQIMPADGWGAAFADGEDEIVSPLVGWALVQDASGASAVVGLVASDDQVELCDDDSDFTGYVYLPDAADEFELETDLFDEVDAADFDEEDDDDFDDDDPGSQPGDGPAFDPKAGHLN